NPVVVFGKFGSKAASVPQLVGIGEWFLALLLLGLGAGNHLGVLSGVNRLGGAGAGMRSWPCVLPHRLECSRWATTLSTDDEAGSAPAACASSWCHPSPGGHTCADLSAGRPAHSGGGASSRRRPRAGQTSPRRRRRLAVPNQQWSRAVGLRARRACQSSSCHASARHLHRHLGHFLREGGSPLATHAIVSHGFSVVLGSTDCRVVRWQGGVARPQLVGVPVTIVVGHGFWPLEGPAANGGSGVS